jgi:uncharacterized protein
MVNEPLPPPLRSFWKKLFLSPDEPRLRAGWRLAIQTLLMLVLAVLAVFPTSLLYLVFHLKISSPEYLAISLLIQLVVFTLSVYLARRLLDRRSFASLGLKLDRQVLPDLLAGLIIPFILLGLIFLAMRAFGWIQFQGFAWPFRPPSVILGQTLLFFVIFIFVGWQEELLSRGYHLQTISSGANLFWGVLISSVIFGLMHLRNPNVTWFSVAGIFLSGLFLALGYIRTGQLWLSIGLHIGWNFCEGIVFGFPVSGFATFPLIQISFTGPLLWTGGAFGPEAGLILLPALLLGALLVILYTSWRNHSTLGKNSSPKM